MENISSTTLATEYREIQEAEKALKSRKDAVSKEIRRRLDAGLEVGNDTVVMAIQWRNLRTYRVKSALNAIRKFKLDAEVLLKVVNSAVKALPVDVQAALPYVEEPVPALVVKPRK